MLFTKTTPIIFMLLVLFVFVIGNILAGNTDAFDPRSVNSLDKSVPTEVSQEDLNEVEDDYK